MEWTRPMIDYNGVTTSWRAPDEVDALPGDKIEFDRGPYRHVGIADGKGGVYHRGEPTQKTRGVTTSWRAPDEVDALPGDKIEFDRGPYRHVGIADGKGGVYHFSGEPTQKTQAYYRHDDIKAVAGKDKVRVNNQEDTKMKPLPRREIVKRAKKHVGKGHGTYNLTQNNCEHKATEMRYGKPVSEQVLTAKDVAVAAGVAAVVTGGIYAIGSLLFGGNNDDEDDEDSDED